MKRTIILTALLLSGVVVMFTACKKDAAKPVEVKQEIASTKVENGRLVFQTIKEYYDHIESVDPKTAAKPGFHSLREALNASYKHKDSDPGLSPVLADLDKFEFPTGFLATLNDKGEVKIGDEIIWYHDGKKYWIPASEEANLETIKKSPAQIKKSSPYLTVKVNTDNARTALGNTGLNAAQQHEFTPYNAITGAPMVGLANGNPHVRKYVHEIYAKIDDYGYDGGAKIWRAHVILRLKMEWRGCCDWNANASEERSESISITGQCELPGMSRFSQYISGPTFTKNESNPSTRENLDFPLVTAEVVGNVPSTWYVDMSGTITSNFVGSSPSSGLWNNSGVLW